MINNNNIHHSGSKH